MNCPLRKIDYFAPVAPGRIDHLKRQNITVEDYSSGLANLIASLVDTQMMKEI